MEHSVTTMFIDLVIIYYLLITSQYHHRGFCNASPTVRVTVKLHEQAQNISSESEDHHPHHHRQEPAEANRHALAEIADDQNRHLPLLSKTRHHKSQAQHHNVSNQNNKDVQAGVKDNDEECLSCKLLREEFLEPMSNDDMRQARIESVKWTILDKLRLAKPPNISINATQRDSIIPPWLLQQYSETGSEDTTEEYYGETEEITNFANDVYDCTSPETPNLPSVCMKFKMKESLYYENSIESVKLYVHYKPTIKYEEGKQQEYNQWKYLQLIDVTYAEPREMKRQYVSPDSDKEWFEYDVENTIDQWIVDSQGKTQLTFKVTCNDCRGLVEDMTSHKASMLFKMKHSPSRTRRSIDQCNNENKDCCLQKFYINFREAGWDWIQQPEGYWANYCTGPCLARSGHLAYQHSMVMSRTKSKKYRACCNPTKLEPLSVLFLNDDFMVIKSNIPNMKIESCGCA